MLIYYTSCSSSPVSNLIVDDLSSSVPSVFFTIEGPVRVLIYKRFSSGRLNCFTSGELSYYRSRLPLLLSSLKLIAMVWSSLPIPPPRVDGYLVGYALVIKVTWALAANLSALYVSIYLGLSLSGVIMFHLFYYNFGGRLTFLGALFVNKYWSCS